MHVTKSMLSTLSPVFGANAIRGHLTGFRGTSTETHKINPLVWLDDLDFLLQEMEANSELEEALQVAKLWDR